MDKINEENTFEESGFLFSDRCAEEYYLSMKNFEFDGTTHQLLRAIGPYSDGERFVERASKDLNPDILNQTKERLACESKKISYKDIERMASDCMKKEAVKGKTGLAWLLGLMVSKDMYKTLPYYYFLEQAYQKELLKLVQTKISLDNGN